MKYNLKAQIGIFLILALVVVVSIGFYFFLRQAYFSHVPKEFTSAYEVYLSCVEEKIGEGVGILESRGGRIEDKNWNGVYFFGEKVMFWKNIEFGKIGEQVPSLEEMEGELARFLEKQNLDECLKTRSLNKNFKIIINSEIRDVDVRIDENRIKVDFDQLLEIKKGDSVWNREKHSLTLSSELGRLYDDAVKVYSHEKRTNFLENYTLDLLRLYFPVDGVDLECRNVEINLDEGKNLFKEVLESNLPLLNLDTENSLKSTTNSAYLTKKTNEKIRSDVKFLFLREWPIEMNILSSGEKAIALPFNDESTRICYTPYHFVYNLDFPVLVKVIGEEESFQFALMILIRKNRPATNFSVEEGGFCENANRKMRIISYDSSLNPVEVNVYLKCADSLCYLGKSSISGGRAVLESSVPYCRNGRIIVENSDYGMQSYLFSETDSELEVVLSSKKTLMIELLNMQQNVNYLLVFRGEDEIKRVNFPLQKRLDLEEGFYEVELYGFDGKGKLIKFAKGSVYIDNGNFTKLRISIDEKEEGKLKLSLS